MGIRMGWWAGDICFFFFFCFFFVFFSKTGSSFIVMSPMKWLSMNKF